MIDPRDGHRRYTRRYFTTLALFCLERPLSTDQTSTILIISAPYPRTMINSAALIFDEIRGLVEEQLIDASIVLPLYPVT